jgi:two-component system chemotaxis sensor kinase CheA
MQAMTRVQEKGNGGSLSLAHLGDGSTPASPSALSENKLRVDVALLDQLMNLVGELVLARNHLLQFATSQKESAFLATAQHLNLITSQLQEKVMKTRMQPIGNVWKKFPRLVRDLALACDKPVRLILEGQETELDKTIIEAIKDPLIHLVRNAVDHGIENAELRRSRGKLPEGRLLLRAFHEGGQVNIELSDDGAGIYPRLVKTKAQARGILTADQAGRLGDRELLQLIFLPGFSTAEKITSVSGRGVGMDVVKTNIEKIGGMVDVQSHLGHGTTVKIKIPLTLAIIPALIVTCGNRNYAIPQVSLLELVRLENPQAGKGIECIVGTPVYRLRGQLLPLVFLDRELGLHPAPQTPPGDAIHIVVLQGGERPFGLVVEKINDTEEIVVKPLSKQVKGIPVFAGATIRGDGRVALILDVLGLAQRAGVVTEVRNRAMADAAADVTVQSVAKQSVLLCRLGANRQLAIPLSRVARLEEIPRAALERSGTQDVVQYRGRILPLVHLSKLLPGSVSESEPKLDPLQVVVYADGDQGVGLMVDRILDIVETTIEGDVAGSGGEIFTTSVIQNRVTDLLDVPCLLKNKAAWLSAGSPRLGGGSN